MKNMFFEMFFHDYYVAFFMENFDIMGFFSFYKFSFLLSFPIISYKPCTILCALFCAKSFIFHNVIVFFEWGLLNLLWTLYYALHKTLRIG